jgi:hypothetical protein
MENHEHNDGLALSDLKATDRLRLETKNHRYEFELVDPAEKRGLLSGGTVGDKPREAVLVGSMAKNTSGFDCDKLIVRMGDRVLFGIITDDKLQSFFTSGVRRLTVIRGSEHPRDMTATSKSLD